MDMMKKWHDENEDLISEEEDNVDSEYKNFL